MGSIKVDGGCAREEEAEEGKEKETPVNGERRLAIKDFGAEGT